MIRLLVPEEEGCYRHLCETQPVPGARILTQLAVYGHGSAIATHWMAQTQSGEPTAAILRFSGRMVIVPTPRLDLPELVEFLGVMGGFTTLEATPELCARLSPHIPGRYCTSHILAYSGPGFGGTHREVCMEPPLEEVYRLLCAGNPRMAKDMGWDSWYPHVSHIVRHRLGFCAVSRRDGQGVATGGVYVSSPRYAVIGSIFTLPEHRGQGHASRITRCLVDRCLETGKTPALYCARDSLLNFYRPLGFAPFSRWGELRLSAN